MSTVGHEISLPRDQKHQPPTFPPKKIIQKQRVKADKNPHAVSDKDIPGVSIFSTKLRRDDAHCYQEPCAFPLTGATVGQHSHGGCTEEHKNAHFCRVVEEQLRVCTDTQKFLLSRFRFLGIPQRLLRTEVSYFYSTLLSPVHRGSELRVRCPQTPAMLAISLLLVNELKWTQGDMFIFLSLIISTYAKNPVCSSVGVCLACGETWWLEAAAFSADHIGDSRG